MRFEELDGRTRTHMVRRFDAEEESGAPYRSAELSHAGLLAYPAIARAELESATGTEETLAAALLKPAFWLDHYYQQRRTGPVRMPIKPAHSAARLALTEFNTWYVAGLADRLVEEGETQCEIYRAQDPKGDRGECTHYEGDIVPLEPIIAGHRIRYWPAPGVPDALSIPTQFNCHHTIRRVPREP